jgi:hypothetical protein
MVFNKLKEKFKGLWADKKTPPPNQEEKKLLSRSLGKNEKYFRDTFNRCSDVIFRKLKAPVVKRTV